MGTSLTKRLQPSLIKWQNCWRNTFHF